MRWFKSLISGSNMADIRRRIRRIQQRNAGNIPERVFRDRLNPLEVYSEDEIFSRYRFRPHSIEILVRLVSGDIARDTRRSKPHFMYRCRTTICTHLYYKTAYKLLQRCIHYLKLY